jgi:PTS hybrid protein
MVGIVVVSHSAELASGLSELAGQMAGPDVAIEAAGGRADGGLGTDEDLVRGAIKRAGQAGDGVVVLGDLGSSILTVSAAVVASAGASMDDVVRAAEEARDAHKL